jgi:polyisoprenoid-binding protein YceI
MRQAVLRRATKTLIRCTRIAPGVVRHWRPRGLQMNSGLASASPVTYTIDPNHTHPEFEADHLGGVSVWRGLFKKTSGTITLDTAAQTGALDVAIDIASVEFGNDKLNDEAVHSSAPAIFEAQKYPTAYYKGTLGGFVNGSPTTVAGALTIPSNACSIYRRRKSTCAARMRRLHLTAPTSASPSVKGMGSKWK